MIKGSTQWEDITIVNICAYKMGANKYIHWISTRVRGKCTTIWKIKGKIIACLHQWTEYPEIKSLRKHWP